MATGPQKCVVLGPVGELIKADSRDPSDDMAVGVGGGWIGEAVLVSTGGGRCWLVASMHRHDDALLIDRFTPPPSLRTHPPIHPTYTIDPHPTANQSTTLGTHLLNHKRRPPEMDASNPPSPVLAVPSFALASGEDNDDGVGRTGGGGPKWKTQRREPVCGGVP